MSNAADAPHEEGAAVYTEVSKRLQNEREVRWAAAGAVSAPRIRCECWRPNCDVVLVMSEREWRELLSQPNRFAVIPEHAGHPLEGTVQEYPHFSIVEKLGKAGVLAAELAWAT